MTYNGKPVSGGLLVFSPDTKEKNPGPPASVKVGADGSYSSSKVVPGSAKLTYTPPPDEYPPGVEPKASTPPPPSPFKGLTAKDKTVTIKPGTSTLDIELVGPKKPGG